MNQLAGSTSPYLLQHQHNPVHWYGWGNDAFKTAREQDKPILFSSGYAACHWCHVMAHECFENLDIAAYMNEHFVNIKLDREERPDVDRLYMAALHAMGEQGGWPLTMFLTPDLKPFWGGTYFPPAPKYGRPGFLQVLTAISNLWHTDRTRAVSGADAITDHLRSTAPATETQLPPPDLQLQQADIINSACDPVRGGLKGAPKFPQAPLFAFLWQQALKHQNQKLAASVITTLTNISQGGIYDHLGGGIARYSTDADWLVPHFEKMLYDNAQFISLATRATLATDNLLFKHRISETAAFLLSELRTPTGLFTSAYGADSEGEEGKYYVWSEAELRHILPPDSADEFCRIYGVSPHGNFEGRNILNRIAHPAIDNPEVEQRLALARQELLQQRHNRIPPLHDDKSLADWNALAITAFTEAALVFGNQEWLDAALDAHAAAVSTFWNGAHLQHSHRNRKTQHRATAHDYALLIEATLLLAAVSADQSLIKLAVKLTQSFVDQHWSDEQGGFLLTAHDALDIPANNLPLQDDVTPSPNAVAVKNYLRLAYATGQEEYAEKAVALLKRHIATAQANPFAAPSLLAAASMAQETWQLTLYGIEAPIRHSLLRQALKHTGLDVVLIHKPAGATPPGSFTLCRGPTCSLPISSVEDLSAAFALFGLSPKQ